MIYSLDDSLIIIVVPEIHDDLFQVCIVDKILKLNRKRNGDTIFVETFNVWKLYCLVNTRENDKLETRWTGMQASKLCSVTQLVEMDVILYSH